MHETVISKQLIADAEKIANGGKIKGMSIEVGELAHIPAQDLEPTLSELCSWPVDVVETSSIVKCDCGFEGKPNILDKGHDHTMWACPECEELAPKAVEGDQIILKGVEVE